MTLTSGLSAVSVFLAESTLRSPMRSMLCRIWRCRFEASTTSMSTIPSVPTPAAARESAAGGGRRGGPQPAGAEEEHAALEELLLAGLTDLGQKDVAPVAVALLGGE